MLYIWFCCAQLNCILLVFFFPSECWQSILFLTPLRPPPPPSTHTHKNQNNNKTKLIPISNNANFHESEHLDTVWLTCTPPPPPPPHTHTKTTHTNKQNKNKQKNTDISSHIIYMTIKTPLCNIKSVHQIYCFQLYIVQHTCMSQLVKRSKEQIHIG